MRKVCYCKNCDQFGFKEETDKVCKKCGEELYISKYTEQFYMSLPEEEKIRFKAALRSGLEYEGPKEIFVSKLPYVSAKTVVSSRFYCDMKTEDYAKCNFGKDTERYIEEIKDTARKEDYDGIIALNIEFKDYYDPFAQGFIAGSLGVTTPTKYRVHITAELVRFAETK